MVAAAAAERNSVTTAGLVAVTSFDLTKEKKIKAKRRGGSDMLSSTGLLLLDMT